MDVNSAYIVSRGSVSALTFLVWDMLTNLSDEVSYIWNARIAWVKWTYVYVRYFPILSLAATMVLNTGVEVGDNFTPMQCRGWLAEQAFTGLSTVLVVDAILIVRVYVIYSRRKTLLYALLTAFAIEMIAMTVCAALALPRIKVAKGCLVLSSPIVYAGAWLSSMGMQTILFVCTCYRFYTSIDRRLGARSILHVFMRDGVWAFVFIFFINLANILLFRLEDEIVSGIAFVWAIVAFSSAGSHLQLNVLKELIHPTGVSSNVQTTTNLEFCSDETPPSACLSTVPVFPLDDLSSHMRSGSSRLV